MKLNLAVIVKDQTAEVDRVIDSYCKYFDEVHFAVDDAKSFQELIERVSPNNVFFHKYEWVADFAHKRNFIASKMDCDYYFTIDTDDEIVKPEGIRPLALKAAENNVQVVSLWYDYSRDENGNTNAGHYKERIIKNGDEVFWNKKIHENLLPRNPSSYKIVQDDSVKVTHLITPEHAEESCKRNLEFLLREYAEDGENTDPRTIAYLGRSFVGLQMFDRAIPFLEKHIRMSGWDEDRYKSWCDLAECMKQLGRFEEAIAACFEAIEEREDYPDGYLKLHDIYLDLSKWKKAIHWAEIGLKKKTPRTFMITDPSSYTWRPALSLSFCYLQEGEYEKANQLFQYAKKLAPNVDFIKQNESTYTDAIERKKFTEQFVWLYQAIKAQDETLAPKLFAAIPHKMRNHEILNALENRHKPLRVWEDNTVVIHCGTVFEPWSPDSIKTGIGGSEEAVIYLSQELVRQGFEVTVINECGDKEGVYDGVNYVNLYKFNPKDVFYWLISWRTNIFKYKIQAKHKWVWLHDVPKDGWFTEPEELKSFDKLIVLSKFHKGLIPKGVPENKILVSSNGINTKDFSPDEKVERNPHRVIYGSSYDRGLIYLLAMWPEVRKEIPDAELHVFYGMKNMEIVAKENPFYKKLNTDLKALLAQTGVTDHGRVGHKELALEYMKSGVWAYPSDFPEISCITAMKAQEAGAVPVVTSYAALQETVKVGVVIPGKADAPEVRKDFQDSLIAILKETAEQERIRAKLLKNKGIFSWSKVAQQWISEVKKEEDRWFIEDRFKWIQAQCNPNLKIVDVGGEGCTFTDEFNVTTVNLNEIKTPNFYKASAEKLPFEDKQFDIAVLTEILEHVDDPVKAMKEANRVANKIVITVPYEFDWPVGLKPFEHPEHLRFYTRDLLETHLKEAGFTNYKIKKLVQGEWVFYGAIVNE